MCTEKNGRCTARVSGVEISTPAAETRKLLYLVPSLFKQKGWAGHWQSLQSDTNCCVFGVPKKYQSLGGWKLRVDFFSSKKTWVVSMQNLCKTLLEKGVVFARDPWIQTNTQQIKVKVAVVYLGKWEEHLWNGIQYRVKYNDLMSDISNRFCCKQVYGNLLPPQKNRTF